MRSRLNLFRKKTESLLSLVIAYDLEDAMMICQHHPSVVSDGLTIVPYNEDVEILRTTKTASEWVSSEGRGVLYVFSHL